MSVLMLDTVIASAIITQHLDLKRRLASLANADWCISAITRAELKLGVSRDPRAKKLARLVEAFLLAARTEPFDAKSADEYGRLHAHLVREGIGMGAADELIAAHALSIGATLITDSAGRFDHVPELAVLCWGDGTGTTEGAVYSRP